MKICLLLLIERYYLIYMLPWTVWYNGVVRYPKEELLVRVPPIVHLICWHVPPEALVTVHFGPAILHCQLLILLVYGLALDLVLLQHLLLLTQYLLQEAEPASIHHWQETVLYANKCHRSNRHPLNTYTVSTCTNASPSCIWASPWDRPLLADSFWYETAHF